MPNRNPSANEVLARTISEHLASNAADCIHHNILVHVDHINPEGNVAYCSVEQRFTGLLRKRRSVTHLVYQAEQALSPLLGMGILPLLTVRHDSLKNLKAPSPRAHSHSAMDRVRDLWHRLGSPLSREGFDGTAVAQDPFGWREAMDLSGKH